MHKSILATLIGLLGVAAASSAPASSDPFTQSEERNLGERSTARFDEAQERVEGAVERTAELGRLSGGGPGGVETGSNGLVESVPMPGGPMRFFYWKDESSRIVGVEVTSGRSTLVLHEADPKPDQKSALVVTDVAASDTAGPLDVTLKIDTDARSFRTLLSRLSKPARGRAAVNFGRIHDLVAAFEKSAAEARGDRAKIEVAFFIFHDRLRESLFLRLPGRDSAELAVSPSES